MFKDSSIVSTVSLVELTKEYNYLASSTYAYMKLGLITAAIYFMMSYPASVFARSIEKRLSNDQR
jgi:ABC-type amino acid transport system permease subunit